MHSPPHGQNSLTPLVAARRASEAARADDAPGVVECRMNRKTPSMARAARPSTAGCPRLR